MKLLITTLFLFTICFNSLSQVTNHNLTPIGNLPYNIILNDIWGYVDSSGVEYALVGEQQGVSIVSLADPSNPIEVAYVSANFSVWRDIKTYGNRAYAVTEGGGGILIIDLSDLPNSVTHHFHSTLSGTAHNLWIDEQGILYTAGEGAWGGQPVFYDLTIDPDTPVVVGITNPGFYSHDIYVRNDTMWSANINDGFFTVFDISDKSNPQLLATQNTSRNFCHNAWMSDDGQTLFTTDEKPGAWIDAYDVSDLSDIKRIDRWRTPNPNVVPHNVHVHNDFLVTSYYDDGLVILDASRPHNLVEVARYDTYPYPPNTEFDGAWGAYPFLPSGRILVSDRQTGLHIFQPNYVRACWLEGTVTDSLLGTTLFNVDIELTALSINEHTDFTGAYKTGTATPGTYQVTFSKLGYTPKTITTTLQNGQLTIEDVALVPLPTLLLEIDVTDNQSLNPIPNTIIELHSPDSTYIGQTDQNGHFQQQVLSSQYTIWLGHWGHQMQKDSINITTDTLLNIGLNRGYKDEFQLDLGWSISGTAPRGKWVQETPRPIPNFFFPFLSSDANDLGDKCMTTGIYPDSVINTEWLDSGTTVLSSPIMDLSNTIAPYLNFQYHYYNLLPFPMNALEVILTNGTDTVTALSITTRNIVAVWDTIPSIAIKDHISLSSTMQVHFKAAKDNASVGGKVRIWLDDFSVVDSVGNHIAIHSMDNPTTTASISPNPFKKEVTLNYAHVPLPASITVVNTLGQVMESQPIEQPNGRILLGENWERGIYFIQIGTKTLRVIKSQ
ncbi:choice-of-anchor B family protein [Aureispira anguillae]|uniref:Choice-of-anchor B family protein n=1 Tax=Aureispira anguillae TaxID=2864201 RepID=A0A915YDF6_9BACT|nr:choice-of-anchor B family protein [Aureispira anguillae]BDS11029.1 choice-of-anchor B family protein [Aureispira anguillae]